MKQIPICLFFLGYLMTTSFARALIGDDLSQLRANYGSAKLIANQALFQHNGFSICVYFDGTRSGMEVFLRFPEDVAFSQADIDRILAQESRGQTWGEVTSKTGKPTWLTIDHKLLARFSPDVEPKTLVVMKNQ